MLSVHRVGYAGSSRVAGPVSIARQAAHVRALMRHLGIERAHIVGHSSGGNIALQLALDAPAAGAYAIDPRAGAAGRRRLPRMLATRQAAMAPIFEQFRARATRLPPWTASCAWCRAGVPRGHSTRALPGAFERGVADAETFFGQELPAHPAVAVRARGCAPHRATGARRHRREEPGSVADLERAPAASAELAAERRGFRASGTTHLLHVQNPRGMAEALVAFFAPAPMASAR